MAAFLTPAQASKELRALSKGLSKAIRAPMNEARKTARKEMKRRFLSESPGRSIFGKGRKKTGKPTLNIGGRAARASKSKEAFVVIITLKGFAALIEEGGRTKRHRIRAKRGKVLKMRTRTGTAFAPEAQHPGGRVPKKQIGRRVLERTFRALPKAVDRSLAGAIRATRLA